MTKDTRTILRELKTIRAMLDIVVKQTAPKPGPDDFDYLAYWKKFVRESPEPPEPPGQ